MRCVKIRVRDVKAEWGDELYWHPAFTGEINQWLRYNLMQIVLSRNAAVRKYLALRRRDRGRKIKCRWSG
jgi:hypothetical protein